MSDSIFIFIKFQDRLIYILIVVIGMLYYTLNGYAILRLLDALLFVSKNNPLIICFENCIKLRV